jgi:hypothetical protein
MIWQDTHDPAPRRTLLVDRLLRQIPSWCGNPALIESAALTEAAAGVAAYLDQKRTDLLDVTPQASCALVSQALAAAGNLDPARRLRIFGASLVYPDSWVVTGEETVWVLDAAQLLMPTDPRIEIALFERLKSVLTTFADVWDGTRGRGVLGLKNLPAAARTVLGHGVPESRVDNLAGELRSRGGRHLDGLRVERRWDHTPALLSLTL